MDNLAWTRFAAKTNTKETYACIVSPKGLVLATGVSQYKTHPLQAKYASDPKRIYLHAEVDAIVKALRFVTPETLAKCSIHVARSKEYRKFINAPYYGLHKITGPGLAKPCIGCERAIAAFGIQEVVYTENL